MRMDNAPHMGARRAWYISLFAPPDVMQDNYGIALTKHVHPEYFHY